MDALKESHWLSSARFGGREDPLEVTGFEKNHHTENPGHSHSQTMQRLLFNWLPSPHLLNWGPSLVARRVGGTKVSGSGVQQAEFPLHPPAARSLSAWPGCEPSLSHSLAPGEFRSPFPAPIAHPTFYIPSFSHS